MSKVDTCVCNVAAAVSPTVSNVVNTSFFATRFARRRLEQMNAINQYMAFRGVPNWLQNKVRGYYEYLWHSGQAQHHKKAFDELPPMLQMQVRECKERKTSEGCDDSRTPLPSRLASLAAPHCQLHRQF